MSHAFSLDYGDSFQALLDSESNNGIRYRDLSSPEAGKTP